MIFHLGFELPKPEPVALNHAVPELTPKEVRILKEQIRSNGKIMDDYIERLDLMVNKEHHPGRTKFAERLRSRLYLLMEENDTFRKVLWKHFQTEDLLS